MYVRTLDISIFVLPISGFLDALRDTYMQIDIDISLYDVCK